MSESSHQATSEETCAQCGKVLSPNDRVASGDRAFCRSCYASLRAELERAVHVMSTDINYVNAGIGAILGGVAGAAVWWGFTVLTHISFGLVAIVIGFLVAKGAVLLSGGKRSKGLQGLSMVVSLVSFACATYLVNMTFINKALAERGDSNRLGFPPESLEMFQRVAMADAGIMELVFLAIVLYEAWRIPKPIALPPPPA